MRKATTLLAALFLLLAGQAYAQTSDFTLSIPLDDSGELGPYNTGLDGAGVHSGARDVAGPYDLDGDGKMEVLLADYSGGGRVHVIENVGTDMWELVYSTPFLDSTSTTSNARVVAGGDLDGDGRGEIMFLGGRSYSATNPNIDQLPLGLYIFEHTGTDNDYGSELPTAVLEFARPDGELQPGITAEVMAVMDVDGDGDQEVMVPTNSSNAFDYFYIYSANGELNDPFLFFKQELAVNARVNNLGGGSPYAIHPADLDGDGTMEISFHAWNNFNFFNADVTGVDSYTFGDTTASGSVFYKAAPGDYVSLFGGVVVDMDDDGDDEIFYPALQTGNVSVMDYSPGDDVTTVSAANFAYDVIPGVTTLGITAGDLDGDGQMELIGSGTAYSEFQSRTDNGIRFLTFTEYQGGPVTEASSYGTQFSSFEEDFDTDLTQFDQINRDSAGTLSTYYENTAFSGKDRAGKPGGQGSVFVSKLAYLGDPDDDGFNEVALAFQGVDDSTYVINEVFNPADSTYTRTIAEALPNENRAFMRVISGSGFAVSIENERVIMPRDYQIFTGYPNPFASETTLSFELPLAKNVSVKIYDTLGREVATLIDNRPYAADVRHEIKWDGTNQAGQQVASGTYIYALEWGNFRKSTTLTLVR